MSMVLNIAIALPISEMRYQVASKEGTDMCGQHGRHGAGHEMTMDMCMGHGPRMMQGHDPSMCGRHFFTKEEKAEVLERYKDWLEKEAKGVQEMLDELKKE